MSFSIHPAVLFYFFLFTIQESGPAVKAGVSIGSASDASETPDIFLSTMELPLGENLQSTMFSVDTDGVMLAGVVVYGAKGITRYEVELLQASPYQVRPWLPGLRCVYWPPT